MSNFTVIHFLYGVAVGVLLLLSVLTSVAYVVNKVNPLYNMYVSKFCTCASMTLITIYGIYQVTNFWFKNEKREQTAKDIIDAVIGAGVGMLFTLLITMWLL